MSIENHPNFHAVGFVSDMITSLCDRLRGEAPLYRKEILERLHSAFISITEQMEQTVDTIVEEERKNRVTVGHPKGPRN